MDYDILRILGISLGLGLLVGLQREYSDNEIAGIRTFTLVTLLGTLTGQISRSFEQTWLVGAGFLSIALLFGIANLYQRNQKVGDPGQTTEMAGLLMYGVGAYLVIGDTITGVILGAVTALLLHLKHPLEQFVDSLSAKDIKAVMQFTAISLVILPILPNEQYGPYGVFNPREIWWMVVLIVGLSLAGYFLYKQFGKTGGTLTNGLLGGVISSTATTMTYARLSKDASNIDRMAAFIIVTASTVSLCRIVVEVAVVSPASLSVIAPPLAIEILLMAGLCTWLYFYRDTDETEEIPEPENPAQLKSALLFGGLYALILLAVAVARDYLGQSGLLIVSIISGFTDVDAITLSLVNTVNRGVIEASTAWRFMLIAALSNLLFKGGMTAFIGSTKLRNRVLLAFIIAMVGGLLIIWLWQI
jgi:uncharacterized membrane protein (DUF4010 family)